jgi:hypothetical protein
MRTVDRWKSSVLVRLRKLFYFVPFFFSGLGVWFASRYSDVTLRYTTI